jgi:transcription elongation factor Elf1
MLRVLHMTDEQKRNVDRILKRFEQSFECMECGRKFRTLKAAERAYTNGCPKCGGTDIDIGEIRS